jgi:hypothetical protein
MAVAAPCTSGHAVVCHVVIATAICLQEVWCQAITRLSSLAVQTYYEFLPKALYKDER